MRNALLCLFVFLDLVCLAHGQSSPDSSSTNSMNMPEGKNTMNTAPESLVKQVTEHAISGTDVEPNSAFSPMLMWQKGNWNFMFHGELFLNDIQQSGPRGDDKLFSTNWFMGMAQHKIRRGTLTLRAMLSLEPATVTNRQYPELFQQGETAYGRPIVDGQHPHDFVMEVAATYDYKFSENTLFTFYAAPVGDPALGPPAYPHRASASEDPLAPLGHHLEDSTHIADDVITAGITHGFFRVEASGFHGREPDEYRWDIDSGGIDSWSVRATLNPGENWSFQYSIGQLASPEALFANEDLRRMTASLIYNRPLQNGNWNSMLLWGRNESLLDGNVGNAYLLESTLHFLTRNNLWARLENVDRTNELLLGENLLHAGFSERYFARVQAYSVGYDREIGHVPHLSTAIGAQATLYGVPATLQPVYGSHPFGVVGFIRVRMK